ncbi:uncharacterized protein LOC143283526 [Babylonia areolata]|uniref:uncharacterized protein LOC143283526 n=1 Tax=Babylonia areolata TaxID=304850 RepID=UPI003FD4DC2E
MTWTTEYMNIDSSSYAVLSESLNETERDQMPRSLCLVVNLSAFQFHDESKDVMSAQVSSVVNNVIHAVLFPALFFIGFPSNMVNMVVFFRHGLKQRINLCLFCLSAMDLIFVTLAFLMFVEKMGDEDFTTSYRDSGRITKTFVNNHVLGLYTGAIFASNFISSVIAGERCLCVVWPLRSSAVLKTKTIGMVILVGSLFLFGGRFLAEMKYHIVCVVDVATGSASNLVTMSEFYRNNQNLINALDGTVYGLGLPVAFCIFVIITTAITAVNLRKSSEFQAESSSSSATTLSARNVAVTRMLIYLSLQYIVCCLPNVFFRLSLVVFPELSPTGNWANLYFFLIAVIGMCGVVNSSLNVVVYYFFGSKYRETVKEMVCRCRKSK